jgi:hypothetical protein
MDRNERAERRQQQLDQHDAYVENVQRGIDPIGRAHDALAAGLPIYQTELVLSQLVSGVSQFGATGNRSVRVAGADEALAEIERIGWRLEHVDYVFVTTGGTTSNRLTSTGQGEVTQGETRGVYLFRRAA